MRLRKRAAYREKISGIFRSSHFSEGSVRGLGRDLRSNPGAYCRSRSSTTRANESWEVGSPRGLLFGHCAVDQVHASAEAIQPPRLTASPTCLIHQERPRQDTSSRVLHDWLEYGALASGPLFRPIDRRGRVIDRSLSGEAVGELLRRRFFEVGLDATGFTGHSFQAGFVSAAVEQGEALWRVRHQTGHASDQSAYRYIRCDLNPVNVLRAPIS
jgi:hypothetical protein